MIVPITSLDSDCHVWLVDWYGHKGIFGEGVLWASIHDSSGSVSHVCIDRRSDSATYNRLFELARHPSDDRAMLIDLGSSEEGIIVSLISHWCDDPGNWLSNGGNHWDWFMEFVTNALVSIGSSSD